MASPTQWNGLSELWEIVKDREAWHTAGSRLSDYTTTMCQKGIGAFDDRQRNAANEGTASGFPWRHCSG